MRHVIRVFPVLSLGGGYRVIEISKSLDEYNTSR
jgi:hypothetical protein